VARGFYLDARAGWERAWDFCRLLGIRKWRRIREAISVGRCGGLFCFGCDGG
jgi:hypothetical protein